MNADQKEAAPNTTGLGQEIPPLGASQSRPVNKKLVAVMVAIFFLFVGGVLYVVKTLKPGDSKPKKVEQLVIADPPERPRLNPPPPPAVTQPIPLVGETVAPGAAPQVPGRAPIAADLTKSTGPTVVDKRTASGSVKSDSGGGQSGGEDPAAVARRELIAKRTGGGVSGAGAAKSSSSGPAASPSTAASQPDGNKPCDMGFDITPEERRRRNALYGCDKLSEKLSDEGLQTEFTGVQARVTPTKPSLLISRGSNIACVMDLRIISDFDGQVSCTVPNDIYSFDGKSRLLPKGTRLLGTFKSSNVKPVQERVGVVWDRIRTPYGVDIEISDPGTDPMGGAGLPGRYEGYYWQKISTGVWLSSIADLFKYAEYKYAPKLKTVTATAAGTIVTEQPFDSALVRNLSKISEQTVGRLLDRPGSVIVDQGQLVNTVVTRDISFESISEGVRRER